MSELKFYKCSHCGNVLIPAFDAGVIPFCCGEKMQILEAGVTDAALEKHVPVVEKADDKHHVTIKVGAVAHPMTDEHYIQFIALAIGGRIYVSKLTPADAPEAKFSIRDNSQPFTVYEYCNLHGLWKTEA
ncbi:MAG: desulfoferrodoxin [Clostridiales Family XIII bacterium]|jgi:superoxide reductase|nr:desulfoferrodoxin [Clostridiales Family XIII bacterium]